MSLKNSIPRINITEIFAHSCNSGLITLADRCEMLAVLLQETPSQADLASIDRLLYAIRHGWLKVKA